MKEAESVCARSTGRKFPIRISEISVCQMERYFPLQGDSNHPRRMILLFRGIDRLSSSFS